MVSTNGGIGEEYVNEITVIHKISNVCSETLGLFEHVAPSDVDCVKVGVAL